MSWYLITKYLHIVAVIMMTGGVFARQLVRGIARKNNDLNMIATLTRVAERIDRLMVIPGSNATLLVGIALALMAGFPIFGFLQGAQENWLLVSNILLVIMLVIIFSVFVPFNKKLAAILQNALAEGHVTQELTAALADRRIAYAHHFEEAAILIIAALMVLRPF